MHGILPDTPTTAPTDASRSVLDHLHRLLVRPADEQPAMGEMLADLANAFRAPGAGLAVMSDGVDRFHYPAPTEEPCPLPWEQDPTLLARLGQSRVGVVVERKGGGSLLATLVPAGDGINQVLWLEDPARSTWTDGEAGALALAGQVVARWLAGEQRPRWAEQLDRSTRQQRLEIAAAVTRRLSHDFGNVLTGILGFTELAMAQQVPANTPLYSYINEVYRAAQTGAQLTHQLRMFSRRQSSTSRTCHLHPVLAEQEARLFSAHETGVNLRLNVPTDLPPVALDGEHLAYVLASLLDNAREALVGPGSISVAARLHDLTETECQDLYGCARPGPHVEITIADTGVGLTPEVQRRLFSEPFFTTKPRRRGFGLAVSYGILQAHRGAMRLHPGLEGGVVARVLLPVAPREERVVSAQPVARSEESVAPAGRPRSERILVVDDEPEVLQFVTASLEKAGYRVDVARNGETAFETFVAQSADPYRLVLTDVVMPGITGVDLVRRLLKRDASLRVLFMSAHVSSDFAQQDFANCAFELLTKPFRADHLLRVVRATLDRPTRRAGGAVEPSMLPTPARK